ncbi:insulin-like growth factor-binding protein complex acid labile subunit [Monomorium pharaonis]|uniref:insulin-like growth factor-binding protein complex acid labile subunit n=1 Tax=Monomorium pharaonis TaxID=307658 RepID=UPI00174716F4|nr:insulin-like growth factor-binding protein complex acid labile subunit [Monomorium pharaonis]
MRFEICRVSLLVLACVFVFIGTAIAACTTSRYEDGFGDRLKCSNVTLNTTLVSGEQVLRDIMIFQSRIENIPDRTFQKYSTNLISLNMHDCGIKEISGYAFDGLRKLKKLGLPYNYITSVRDQWFAGLTSLEQLDLSYNLITSIEPTVFERLRGLKWLDIRENRLTCLESTQLVPMAGLEKFRFSGNPLTFRCRGTLTLWLRDLGINYKAEQNGQENWLDSVLWLCAADDDKIADSEVLMKECIILNLFNQLRTGLTTAEFFPLFTPQECINARNELTKCIAADRKYGREVITNGHVVRKLLRQLKESKSA